MPHLSLDFREVGAMRIRRKNRSPIMYSAKRSIRRVDFVTGPTFLFHPTLSIPVNKLIYHPKNGYHKG
jgi:hypothetical protein